MLIHRSIHTQIIALVGLQGKLEDWPQLAPLPIEAEEDELSEDHKVPGPSKKYYE